MEIDYAIIARSADLGADGTISALGMGFERIRSSVMPRAFPICLLVRLTGVPKSDNLLIEIEVIGPDGETVLEAPISQRVSPRPLGDAKVSPDHTANIIFGMPGLVLPVFGGYEIRARITGSENAVERSFPVKVEKADG